MANRNEAEAPASAGPTPDDVARRAYELYDARGREPGRALEDDNRPEPATRRTRRTAHVTSTPETPAPQLSCPTCDRPLVYRQTVVGGVKPLERWDYFTCRTCGEFVYRDRTKQLRGAT